MMRIAAAVAFLACAPYVAAQQISTEEFVTMAASSDMFESRSSHLAAGHLGRGRPVARRCATPTILSRQGFTS
ncbi:hypothetical protein CN166_23575 [Sinorhizobium medicae]|nr:hypothetical protein [Sinorhizobium medicae]MQX95837.1 hypothetical protein [Sinorhizobium medicae]RVJ53656.1 hypothetical protein CN166_23575 [Sinorhizobium medicae]RVJ71697.1 hypothetical protein CN167_22435 [Sinorhizobium medicae]RVK10932.1 hypothetical protein CN165_28215 [Sinorhizobium medicae]